MSVEDKNSHFGSTIINVHSHMTVGVLKEKVFQDFGFPCEIQRWILGRVLADDDHKSLEFYNVTSAGCTIFLYLVELEAKNFTSTWENPVIGFTNKVKIERPAKAQTKCHHETKRKKLLNQSTKLIPQLQIPEPHSVTVSDITPTVNAEDSEDDSVVKELKQKENTQVDANWTCPSCTLVNSVDRPGCEACTMERPRDVDFKSFQKLSWEQEMVILESSGCVINTEPFKCSICLSWFKCGEGVVLRNCLHHFCRDCLSSSIKYSESADVKCPFGDKDFQCTFPLQEREIKDLLNEYEYQKYLDKCLKQAAWTMKNIFHCKTVNCKGICEYDDGVKTFSCNICNQINCLICQAQHHKETCQQYQNDLSNKEDEATLQTRKLFEDIIHRGDGMFCPQCTVMLIRKWGCDWMRCPMCKTEICWVTQGRRWGPKGEGDTSGGCRCGVNGRKCHPKCNYCH